MGWTLLVGHADKREGKDRGVPRGAWRWRGDEPRAADAVGTRSGGLVFAWYFLDHAGPVVSTPGAGTHVGAHPHIGLLSDQVLPHVQRGLSGTLHIEDGLILTGEVGGKVSTGRRKLLPRPRLNLSGRFGLCSRSVLLT